VDIFVAEMNNLARSLGMLRTRFSTPSGADVWKRNSYSTATDMAKLAVTLSTNNAYGFYAKQKQRSLRVLRSDGREASIAVVNSNKLLNSTLKVEGLKAGYSQQAGQCYSIMANHDSYLENLPDGTQRVTPVQLVLVVLGSANAEGFSKTLITQGWQQYENWRSRGYLASPDRREFLKIPTAAQ
jgi:D-alanyl-D-alanine carboxypeptidase